MKACLVVYKYTSPLDDPTAYPLGFMYISATLKNAGVEVKLLNYNLWKYDFKEEIKDQDVVLFTGFEMFKDNIIRDSLICRELGIRTILGGALATFCFNDMLSYVDTVVIGEGEDVVVKSLTYKGSILIGNKPNLSSLSYPDYDGIQIREYMKRTGSSHIGILTSRGCPFSCTFCAQTCAYQERSIDSVFTEIDYYVSKYGIDTIIFNDNTLNVKRSRFLSVCEKMQDRMLLWSGAIRCDVFDEEMASAAKKSGCFTLVAGVESFNQNKLNRMNKGIKVQDIYKTLDLLNKYKIGYYSNIMLGFDDETYSDVAKEVCSIPFGYNVFPCLVQPFIGTKDGKTRLLSKDEIDFLSATFNNYVLERGYRLT